MTRNEGPILLTGATGFVGMELLVRILEHTDRDVIALVRASDNEAAQGRIDEVLATLLPPGERPRRGRVRAQAADLTSPGLGLSTMARDLLADSYAAKHLTAASAAAEGVIDEIVAPSDTRGRLASSLRTLARPARPVRPARNIPL